MRICMARSLKYTVDFGTAHETDLHHMEIPVTFTMVQSGTVHGLAFWFDVAFIGHECVLSELFREIVECLLFVPFIGLELRG